MTTLLLEVKSLLSFSFDRSLILQKGGTAGNVVAARLTENPDVCVLVLEAGISFVTNYTKSCHKLNV